VVQAAAMGCSAEETTNVALGSHCQDQESNASGGYHVALSSGKLQEKDIMLEDEVGILLDRQTWSGCSGAENHGSLSSDELQEKDITS